MRVALYRVAQEAISNAIRHAEATALRLSLEEIDGRILMRIEDNGKGFDANVKRSSDGVGLRMIREQVRNLDGEVQVTTGPNGTKLEITIPLEPNE